VPSLTVAYPLDSDEFDLKRRFSGMDRLLGVSPAEAVRNAHVAVIGIGGVGSWAAEALARSGIGRLTLVDMDHIAESNINRQVHALSSTLGMSKIFAMRDRIALINPLCVVNCVDAFVDPTNWPNILPVEVDAVIDACDQVKSKTAMAEWARRNKKIFITVGAAGGKRHAYKVDIADLGDTTHDPLLAHVRYRLRRECNAPRAGKKMGITCVFSREAVAGPDASCASPADGTLNCHGYGSIVTVTATFGLCAAGWVIDKISEAVKIEA
jgi:tRNA A37 threonylcarbamoyladenosine dehydratase